MNIHTFFLTVYRTTILSIDACLNNRIFTRFSWQCVLHNNLSTNICQNNRIFTRFYWQCVLHNHLSTDVCLCTGIFTRFSDSVYCTIISLSISLLFCPSCDPPHVFLIFTNTITVYSYNIHYCNQGRGFGSARIRNHFPSWIRTQKGKLKNNNRENARKFIIIVIALTFWKKI